MWFRRLQSQSNASAVVQSEAEPRQVRGRWAEQTDPVIICSDCSPSGVREGDEEEDEEEEFHPQSLEELLVEEEEDKDEKQASGEHGSYVLYTASDDASIYSHRALGSRYNCNCVLRWVLVPWVQDLEQGCQVSFWLLGLLPSDGLLMLGNNSHEPQPDAIALYAWPDGTE
ncbi:hypothetical protein D4764_12G0011320 [Takifugu flavidus]|uniref:Uncharacterized protein n=1 Tax=Takifugu flavidus TaxID=433684 RepID=A0A5C6PD82_9TELE|nr:hypothetical protein D4764_12G0011320 [Takifugu flavidus]